jgi:hypothetical protein
MNDNNSPIGMDSRGRMFADITYLMLKGAGYAAALVIGLWLVVAVTAAIGEALPERSREAPDPTPMSVLQVPVLGLTETV